MPDSNHSTSPGALVTSSRAPSLHRHRQEHRCQTTTATIHYTVVSTAPVNMAVPTVSGTSPTATRSQQPTARGLETRRRLRLPVAALRPLRRQLPGDQPERPRRPTRPPPTTLATPCASPSRAANAGGSHRGRAADDVIAGLEASVPPPVLRQSTNLSPVSGSVLVKLPGSRPSRTITSAVDIPDGSTIDATRGPSR